MSRCACARIIKRKTREKGDGSRIKGAKITWNYFNSSPVTIRYDHFMQRCVASEKRCTQKSAAASRSNIMTNNLHKAKGERWNTMERNLRVVFVFFLFFSFVCCEWKWFWFCDRKRRFCAQNRVSLLFSLWFFCSFCRFGSPNVHAVLSVVWAFFWRFDAHTVNVVALAKRDEPNERTDER